MEMREVARALSFTRAADERNAAQPSVDARDPTAWGKARRRPVPARATAGDHHQSSTSGWLPLLRECYDRAIGAHMSPHRSSAAATRRGLRSRLIDLSPSVSQVPELQRAVGRPKW